MQPQKDDLGYWTGWAVAVGMACVFFAALLAKEPSVYSLLCSTEDTNCGREWIAAMSGWVAALVAGITIYFLWLQIKSTDWQNQRLREKERKSTLLIINNARIQAAKAIEILEFIESVRNSNVGINQYTFRITVLNNIRDIIDSDEVQTYARNIGTVSAISRNIILRNIDGELTASQRIIQIYREASGPSPDREETTAVTFSNTVKFCDTYVRELLKHADEAMAETIRS